jgi:hypothetical protein
MERCIGCHLPFPPGEMVIGEALNTRVRGNNDQSRMGLGLPTPGTWPVGPAAGRRLFCLVATQITVLVTFSNIPPSE